MAPTILGWLLYGYIFPWGWDIPFSLPTGSSHANCT